jgi:hypothetical protein
MHCCSSRPRSVEAPAGAPAGSDPPQRRRRAAGGRGRKLKVRMWQALGGALSPALGALDGLLRPVKVKPRPCQLPR